MESKMEMIRAVLFLRERFGDTMASTEINIINEFYCRYDNLLLI